LCHSERMADPDAGDLDADLVEQQRRARGLSYLQSVSMTVTTVVLALGVMSFLDLDRLPRLAVGGVIVTVLILMGNVIFRFYNRRQLQRH
jgi:uncharacterized protein related to proFAR isomerase